MTGEELRDSIFQMAVSGQLVPQNPNDEPASILLEQIETEKDKLVKEGKRKRQKKSKILKRDGSFYEVSGRKEICLDEELPFDIPDSWEWSRFFNLTDLYTGNSINKTVKENKYTGLDNGYNYIATKDVGFNKDIDYENGVKIPYEEDFRIAPENSILMCIEGGSAGRKIAKTNQDVCFGNKLCCFTPSLIDQDYIYAFLQNPGFKEIFRNNLTGIIGGVSISKLRNILIPIPPKEEQKRIVNKLNELEPLIQQYSDLYDNLEYLDKEFPSKLRDSILKEAIQGNLTEQNLENESSQELLKDMEVYKNKLLKKKEINVKKHFPKVRKENNSFYQIEKNKKVCLDGELPFSIPDNWSWDYLNNIGFWKSGSTPSRSHPEYYENGTIPWLKTGDLNDSIILNIPEKINEKALKNSSLRINPVDSVLIAMYGATIGKLGILKIPATTNQACCACTLYGDFLPEYLFKFLQANRYNFIKMGEGGAQPNISKEKIINTLIPIPPLEEQKRINQIIDKLFKEINKLDINRTE